jgi:hypothetical protein
MTKHSFEEKLERADYHLQSLKAQIERWQLSNPYVIAYDIDQETGDDIVRFKSIDSAPRPIAQIIGDCFHNLRCVLDSRRPPSGRIAGWCRIRGIQTDAAPLRMLARFQSKPRLQSHFIVLLHDKSSLNAM